MGRVGIRAALSRRQQAEIDRVFAAGRKAATAELHAQINDNVRKAEDALEAGDHQAARAFADEAQAAVFVRAMNAGGVDLS